MVVITSGIIGDDDFFLPQAPSQLKGMGSTRNPAFFLGTALKINMDETP